MQVAKGQTQRMENHPVSEVRIFPYYAGFLVDVSAAAVSEGVYFDDQIFSSK